MPMPAQRFDSLFGSFIWSHIPLQQLDAFIEAGCRQVVPGSTMVFMDNRYVEGSNLPISHKDAYGNTFQTRHLESGARYAVLKNFPQADFVTQQLRGKTIDVEVIRLPYFWIAICKNN